MTASLMGENVAGVVAGSPESTATSAKNSLVKLKRRESHYEAGILDTEGLPQVTACTLTGRRVRFLQDELLRVEGTCMSHVNWRAFPIMMLPAVTTDPTGSCG